MNLSVIPQLLIIGIAGGSMVALNAIGVTLIYGTVRAINLAQGDMFALVTVFVATIVAALGIDPSWPPDVLLAALAITLIASTALGAGLSLLIELLAFRPFRGGSRLSPLIATLGLSFIIYQVAILWRQAAPSLLKRGGALVMGFPDIIPSANLIPGSGVILTAKDVIAVVLGLSFALAAHVLITRTKTGKALRAVAQDADLARMFGVNVNAAIRSALIIGGGLSGAAAFIYSIYYTQSFNQQGAQTGLVVFAAAILGDIGSPVGAFISGIVLGIFSAFSDYFLDARWTPVLLQLALIALLVWRPTGLTNAAEDEGLRPRPVLSSDFRARVSRPAGWVLVMALVVALAYPFVDRQLGWYYQPVVNHVLILGMMALGLNILVGSAGLLDLGFAVSFAIGGYAAAILTDPYGVLAKTVGLTAFQPFDIVIVLAFAAAIAGLFGALNGVLTLRLKADYLAVVTFSFGAMTTRSLVNGGSITGGSGGLSALPPPHVLGMVVRDPFNQYFIVLAAMILVALFVHRMLNSRLGRAWVAISEDETAAVSLGIDTAKTRTSAFVISSGVAGLAGALFAITFGVVYPEMGEFLITAMGLSMVILGGAGNTAGVIIASLAVAAYDRVLVPGLSDVLESLRANVLVIGSLSYSTRQLSALTFGLALYLTVLFRSARRR